MIDMTAREITEALDGRWHGTYGTARCPAHDDHEPSLSIRDGVDGEPHRVSAGDVDDHQIILRERLAEHDPLLVVDPQLRKARLHLERRVDPPARDLAVPDEQDPIAFDRPPRHHPCRRTRPAAHRRCRASARSRHRLCLARWR